MKRHHLKNRVVSNKDLVFPEQTCKEGGNTGKTDTFTNSVFHGKGLVPYSAGGLLEQ